MDEALDTWKRALAIYQRDLAGWTMLYGVVLLIALFTFGLGMLLLPNAMRATRDALREERSPDLGALFKFDDIVEDAIAAGGLLIVAMVAGSFLGPLSAAVTFVLGLAPVAVTEEGVGGLDALQASASYLQREPSPVVIHWLISTVVNTPLACCLLPLFVTIPISGIANWLFYEAHRDEILMLESSPS